MRPARLLLATLTLLVISGSARALTPLDGTRTALEETRAIVASDRSHDAKLAELSAVLTRFLDTDRMGREALGAHWQKLSAGQQREFLALFRELFQRTYVQKLLLFEKPDFGYVGEERFGDEARVQTTIITPRDEFAVLYHLRPDGERWRVTDIRIEELSLIANFRRQLDRLLAAASVEEVLGRMRRKYGPGGRGEENGL